MKSFKKFFMFLTTVVLLLSISSTSAWGHTQDEVYIEPGEEVIHDELEEGGCFDGIFYTYAFSDNHADAVNVSSPLIYTDGVYGGFYAGELTVPSEMYGYQGGDKAFTVVGITGMYKNGLTGLYLPETIENIGNTIKECRYLQKVILNNSLKELKGIRDCPVLSICPLPQCLERIGDGWMSGIAISEAIFPESLISIGNDVFSNNPSLANISLGNVEKIGENCFRNLPSLIEISLPSSIQDMQQGCFSNCSNLESVKLPSSAIPLSGAFNGCPSIKAVSVTAEIPYDFPSDCMADTDKTNCTLFVPEGCVDLYSNAEGWKDFGNIIPSIPLGVDINSNTNSSWRAFSFGSKLIIDCEENSEFNIISSSGEVLKTIFCHGRQEISLPSGLYLVKSSIKVVKIMI